MRLSLLPLVLIAACQREKAVEPPAVAGVSAPCALDGATAFDSECRVVRSVVDGRVVLTLSAPDGGFRRVEVAADGSSIASADGAIPATTRNDGTGEIEVAISGDRYRLPAAAR